MICDIRWALCLFSVTVGFAQEQPEGKLSKKSPTNVLFLLADDMQWNAIARLGNPVIQTPNLDRLIGEGTTFSKCYVQGSIHGAVCMPSRAMMLTGRHLWRRGGDQVEGQLLWGEYFLEQGYETFVTGKWHNGEAALKRAFSFIGETGGGMLHSTPKDGDGYNRPLGNGTDDPDGQQDTWNPADTSRKGHWLDRDGEKVHSSARWADQAIGFLEARSKRKDAKPFLAHVAFHAPHDPRQAPQEYLDLYPVENMPLPPNFAANHPFDNGELLVRDEMLAPTPRTEFAVRTHLAEYYALISHMDAQIGRLLETLERLELLDSTLIVFAADHGLAVGQHGLIGKQNLYEHSVRAPLVFKGPGIAAGQSSDILCYLHSIFPTVCDQTGLEVPTSVDAPSLSPVFLGEEGVGRPILCAGYREQQRMATDGRWKLILYPPSQLMQLYDLSVDPWETTNLAGKEGVGAHTARLIEGLRSWMTEVEDPWEMPSDLGGYGAAPH